MIEATLERHHYIHSALVGGEANSKSFVIIEPASMPYATNETAQQVLERNDPAVEVATIEYSKVV